MTGSRDPEIAAMESVSDALSQLSDSEARRRVIGYILARFAPENPPQSSEPVAPTGWGTTRAAIASAPSLGTADVSQGEREIPGIARLSDAGELKITIRDLKARSGLDAAVRLAHVAIYAYERLTGGQALSSSRGLTPILREWRLYDGNTRTRLAKEKGMLRDGDELRLDAHSRRDAEKYIGEILDSAVEGKWRPS